MKRSPQPNSSNREHALFGVQNHQNDDKSSNLAAMPATYFFFLIAIFQRNRKPVSKKFQRIDLANLTRQIVNMLFLEHKIIKMTINREKKKFYI